MGKLDRESQKNLKDAYHFLVYLLMISSLSFIILYFTLEYIPNWSGGFIVIFCGLIVRIIDKKIPLKQMYVICFILILISFLIAIFN